MEWIKLETKLPPERTSILFWNNHTGVILGHVIDGSWFQCSDGEEYSLKDDEITHWMPLPEAPKD